MQTEIRWCRSCLETNTRPTTQFDSEGICIACKNVSIQANSAIDWTSRNEKLKEIISDAKRNRTSSYDCIIGVSGGKDSTRQALFAKECGLNPLLVSCLYPPEQQTPRGVKNLQNLINLGFDTITVSPAPRTSKELMRYCFKTFGNIFNATELALYACLPITAIAYNIPLILLGENPALSYGTDVGSFDFDGNRMKHMNTLKGGNPRTFAPSEVSDDQLFWYRYPSDEEMNRAQLKIVYLGYFMPDFNEHTNAKIAIEHGLTIRDGEDADPERTGSIYPFIALDDDFVIVNQMVKYLKFGFGMTTQQVGSAIRFGEMSRDNGIAIARKYDGKCASDYIDRLCNYLEISLEEFWETVESFIDTSLFEKVGCEWRPRFEIV